MYNISRNGSIKFGYSDLFNLKGGDMKNSLISRFLVILLLTLSVFGQASAGDTSPYDYSLQATTSNRVRDEVARSDLDNLVAITDEGLIHKFVKGVGVVDELEILREQVVVQRPLVYDRVYI